MSGSGADFVARLPTRALDFEARRSRLINTIKVLPKNRSSAVQKVVEVFSESREGDPGVNLGRAIAAGLEESEKTHDSTVNTDDGSAQLAFLNTVRPFSTIILSQLCGKSLVKQTNAVLNLRTDQNYGDAGAEYAAATSSSFGIDFRTPKYAGFFSYYYRTKAILTKKTVDKWKQKGGCLIVEIRLFSSRQSSGHATHAFFASPSEPGIYFDSNNSSTGKLFQAEYNSVERILGEFGLQMTGIACPRTQIQERDYLCVQWSTWSAWLEVLQDLGMVGLLAFAKMAVEDLFPDAKLDVNTDKSRSEDADGTEGDGASEPSEPLHYPFFPYTFPPLDLIPGRNAEVSGSIDEERAIVLSLVHWLRRAHQFIGSIKTSDVRAEKIVRIIRRTLTADGTDGEMAAFMDTVEAGERPSDLTEDEWAQTDPNAPKASLSAIMRIVRLPPDYVEALFPAAARFDRLYGAGAGVGAGA